MTTRGTRSRARAALAAWMIAALACSGGGGADDTYWRFTVDGTDYALEQVEFDVMTLPDGRSFLGLGPAFTSGTPNAAIQWRMPLEGVESLRGRELEFSDIMSTDSGVLATFTLTDDLTAAPDVDSDVSIRIDTVVPPVGQEPGIVEGSFEASDFVLISMTAEGTPRVDVSGSFRAALHVQ